MSLRMLGSLFLLITVAAVIVPMNHATGQAAEDTTIWPKWEYKVITIDGYRCASEEALASSLHASGQQGWELVNYEQAPIPFPKEAEGTLVIRPAATGAGRDVTPQLADSFQGEIGLKIEQPQPPACRLLFKRQAHPPANR